MNNPDQIRRRMEARRNQQPKSVHEVMAPMGAAQFQNQPESEHEMEVVYIKSQNIKSRTKVVGTSVFEFNKDGICKVEIVPGRARLPYDMKELLKLNGFSVYGGENTPEPAPAPAPAPAPVEAAPAPKPEPLPDPQPEQESEPVEAAPEDDSDEEKSDDDKPKRRRRKAKKEND